MSWLQASPADAQHDACAVNLAKEVYVQQLGKLIGGFDSLSSDVSFLLGCAGYLAMMLAYHKLGWIALPPGSCSWCRPATYTGTSPRQSLSGFGAVNTGRSVRFSGSSGAGVLPLSKGVARLASHDLELSVETAGWLLAAGQQGNSPRHKF
jgi:hypothetical protein